MAKMNTVEQRQWASESLPIKNLKTALEKFDIKQSVLENTTVYCASEAG